MRWIWGVQVKQSFNRCCWFCNELLPLIVDWLAAMVIKILLDAIHECAI